MKWLWIIAGIVGLGAIVWLIDEYGVRQVVGMASSTYQGYEVDVTICRKWGRDYSFVVIREPAKSARIAPRNFMLQDLRYAAFLAGDRLTGYVYDLRDHRLYLPEGKTFRVPPGGNTVLLVDDAHTEVIFLDTPFGGGGQFVKTRVRPQILPKVTSEKWKAFFRKEEVSGQ